MSVFGNRRKKLLSLAKGKQLVATKPSNIFYLTDFWGGGAAVVHEDRTLLVTSALDAQRAKEVGKEVEVVVVKRWADLPLRVGRELESGKVLVDDDSQFRKGRRYGWSPGLFLEARRVKDEVEVARINNASRGQDKVFEALEREIRPGRTEWEIAAEALKIATMSELTQSGSDSALSPIIVASGENGALPHGELSERRIRNGDFVVADIFFRSEGYNSDETRTFAVGTVSSEMKGHYRAVLDAQERALETVKEGATCGEVNEAAVKALRVHGVEKHLTHGIGHGVGIDIHELPSISKGSKVRLVRNDVVTVEPGVYFPGRYGIRIEDTVKVDKKPFPLTHYTKELVTVG
ncbi:MAG: aminopeptidase P family protein [Nitrososphaerales archaeon]|nr:aminopeptidase P family protein [Nitrososphaerales archaeon]